MFRNLDLVDVMFIVFTSVVSFAILTGTICLALLSLGVVHV